MEKHKVGNVPEELMTLIKEAVNEGIAAGLKLAKQERTPFQRTEARLYALPALIRKAELDKEELAMLIENGKIPEISKDLIRFNRGGSRLSTEEKLEAVIRYKEATIALDEHEIKVMNTALEQISGDYYYPVILDKYFENRADSELAAKLFCDERTVRRNRGRLVKALSVLLYGAEAVE